MTLNFAHKNWSPASDAQGITVTLMNMHGDADAFTTHTARFPLTDDGVAAAEALLRAFDELSNAVSRKLEASLEDVCGAIALATGIAAETLCVMLEPFVRCDARYEANMARPVAYRFSVADGNGTRFAMYPGPGGPVRYKALSYVDPSYFNDWA